MIYRIRAGLSRDGVNNDQAAWWWLITPQKEPGLSSLFMSRIWRSGSQASESEGNHEVSDLQGG